MARQGFDNDQYLKLQSQHIRERIAQFGGKLYLEFGGKLFDDFHASRVLPGFEPDSKIRMLAQMKDSAEVIIAINAADIEKNKVRGDLGITYDSDVLRLIDAFRSMELYVGSVVVTQYSGQPAADAFQARLEQLGVRVYRHYPIAGYPHNIAHIVSDEGFGKNQYIETSRPLVVVTAPGPGSGKMATCLSQLYHEYRRGVKAGYAKFETFPVWNLSLDHPVNIAYEAATVDLGDVNAIDPFHLESYGVSAVNYNRDIEVFPVLKAAMEKIMGTCPYKSPTDMGVNTIASAIIDDDAVRSASEKEIVRRYFKAAAATRRTGSGEEETAKLDFLMRKAGIDTNLSPAHSAALLKAETSSGQAGAIELPDGRVVTGKTSALLNAPSSVLLNALKAQADIADDIYVISNDALKPICYLRTERLGHKNPHLHPNETLIALSVSSLTNPLAATCIEAAEGLRGCDAYFSSIITDEDERLYRSLGINVCCEPRYETKRSDLD